MVAGTHPTPGLSASHPHPKPPDSPFPLLLKHVPLWPIGSVPGFLSIDSVESNPRSISWLGLLSLSLSLCPRYFSLRHLHLQYALNELAEYFRVKAPVVLFDAVSGLWSLVSDLGSLVSGL